MERMSGFTLVELVITLAVAAILAMIAVPAYRDFVAGQRTSTAVNELVSVVALARTEAITRGEQVSICPSSNALAVAPATPTCGNVSWTEGWIVFADSDNDGAYDAGSDDLIRVHRGVGDDVAMTSSGSNDFIAFNRMGFSQPTFQGSTDNQLTIIACPSSASGQNADARALLLSLSGDVKTAARKTDGSQFSC